MSSPRRPHAFSLVELLVVLGIIVLLLALFLPTISRMRTASRSTKCLANLQQWSQSYQLYLSANHGKSFTEGFGVFWCEVLSPYNSKSGESLFCPEAQTIHGRAADPGPHQWTGVRGTAHDAWSTIGLGKEFASSYGFNIAVSLHWKPGTMTDVFIQYPTREAERIPVLADCIYPMTLAWGGNEVPTNLEDPGGSNGVTTCCINRHGMAVNAMFLDGHAEHVPLPALWKLKWSQNFAQREVRVPR